MKREGLGMRSQVASEVFIDSPTAVFDVNPEQPWSLRLCLTYQPLVLVDPADRGLAGVERSVSTRNTALPR